MNKPYITLKVFIIEIISWVLYLGSLVFAIYKAANTEGLIPVKFSATGEILRYGSPWTIVLMPVLMLFTGVVLSVVLHFLPASAWNMPVKVKPEKALKLYIAVAYMLALLNLEFAVFTALSTVFFAKGDSFMMFAAIGLCVLMFATIGIVIAYIVRANRD